MFCNLYYGKFFLKFLVFVKFEAANCFMINQLCFLLSAYRSCFGLGICIRLKHMIHLRALALFNTI